MTRINDVLITLNGVVCGRYYSGAAVVAIKTMPMWRREMSWYYSVTNDGKRWRRVVVAAWRRRSAWRNVSKRNIDVNAHRRM